tara:strand:- start:1321 stop:1719 length:399 start_codon:yes stop_codon:yes gene_type:complete
MYLILPEASEDNGKAVSHELWMLARPREYSSGETSQYFCGTFAHPDGTKVAIGPIGQFISVHTDANEVAFADLIGHAVTEPEKAAIIEAINAAKGGSIQLIDIIQSLPSTKNNIRTYDQLIADKWFATTEEI